MTDLLGHRVNVNVGDLVANVEIHHADGEAVSADGPAFTAVHAPNV